MKRIFVILLIVLTVFLAAFPIFLAAKNAPNAPVEVFEGVPLNVERAATNKNLYILQLEKALSESTSLMEKQNEENKLLVETVKNLQIKNENLALALESARDELVEVKGLYKEAAVNLEASNKEISRLNKRSTIMGVFVGSNSSFNGYQLGALLGSKLGVGYLNGIVGINPKQNEFDFNIGYSVVF